VRHAAKQQKVRQRPRNAKVIKDLIREMASQIHLKNLIKQYYHGGNKRRGDLAFEPA